MAGAAELNIRLIGTDLASAAFKSATASLRGLTSAVTAPIRGIGALQSGIEGAARSAAVTGGVLTAGITAPVVGGFGKAIAKVIDLETSLNVLQAVTGANAAQMAVASARAIQLGADITLPGVTAAKAGDAMLELAKAGLTFDQVMAATPGTLRLATAGQLGFAEAAKITGRAMNAFNLDGSQATRVADVLAAAANASSVEVRDMAFSFAQASANLAGANVTFEQGAAAMSFAAPDLVTAAYMALKAAGPSRAKISAARPPSEPKMSSSTSWRVPVGSLPTARFRSVMRVGSGLIFPCGERSLPCGRFGTISFMRMLIGIL